MHTLLANLLTDVHLTGVVPVDAPAFLVHHGKPTTAEHSAAVAAEAVRIARIHSVDEQACLHAAWLHDISAVYPSAQRAHIADALGIPLLAEERAFPPIVHQKLSALLARELFGITNPAVLSAIGCHTTLRTGATPLDMVVFVADKIAWDQPGEPPWLADILPALERSLASAALVYLEYLWEHRDTLAVVHPWMAAARADLLASPAVSPS